MEWIFVIVNRVSIKGTHLETLEKLAYFDFWIVVVIGFLVKLANNFVLMSIDLLTRLVETGGMPRKHMPF